MATTWVGAALRGVLIAGALAGMVPGCSRDTATLEGRLVEGRRPVSDVKLRLTPVEAEGDAVEGTTDPQGNFVLEADGGRYELSFERSVSGVFGCTLRYPVVLEPETTVRKRIALPAVDVAPNGTATVAEGGKTRCRTLREPLSAFLCLGARHPIKVFTLPPRDPEDDPGYRRRGVITKNGCESVSVLGRIPGSAVGWQGEPFGWLYVSTKGSSPVRGWVSPFVRSGSTESWSDVAVAAAKRLPTREPTLAGSGMPDLTFTSPKAAHREGESCTLGQFVANTWLFDVRNAGRGLAPKQFTFYLDYRADTETRRLGSKSWLRGLAPGETLSIAPDYTEPGTHRYTLPGSYNRVTLDPENEIRESNEANNTLSLGFLPDLECR